MCSTRDAAALLPPALPPAAAAAAALAAAAGPAGAPEAAEAIFPTGAKLDPLFHALEQNDAECVAGPDCPCAHCAQPGHCGSHWRAGSPAGGQCAESVAAVAVAAAAAGGRCSAAQRRPESARRAAQGEAVRLGEGRPWSPLDEGDVSRLRVGTRSWRYLIVAPWERKDQPGQTWFERQESARTYHLSDSSVPRAGQPVLPANWRISVLTLFHYFSPSAVCMEIFFILSPCFASPFVLPRRQRSRCGCRPRSDRLRNSL